MKQTGVSKSLKALFVRATREGLKSHNLANNDPVIRKARDNVSLNYPLKAEDYPSIWVSTSFSKLSWISLHSELIHQEGYKYNIGEFDARISFEIMALTNEERDALFDAFVNMLMFGSLEQDADLFLKYLASDPVIDVVPVLSELDTSSDSVTIGTPWDPNQLAYTKSITFRTYGTFAQRLDTKELIPLREIDTTIADKFSGDTIDSFSTSTLLREPYI